MFFNYSVLLSLWLLPYLEFRKPCFPPFFLPFFFHFSHSTKHFQGILLIKLNSTQCNYLQENIYIKCNLFARSKGQSESQSITFYCCICCLSPKTKIIASLYHTQQLSPIHFKKSIVEVNEQVAAILIVLLSLLP